MTHQINVSKSVIYETLTADLGDVTFGFEGRRKALYVHVLYTARDHRITWGMVFSGHGSRHDHRSIG
ncbi:hypothetical protein [Rhodococcus rhodochrous]|uniref:hypothetical protein n=1 Tax=Rhodococcus rhodochrous TaxID=1829 RepID=UPI0011AA2B20|nr:hypothetical protein [Rhodococcus rhodochrous]